MKFAFDRQIFGKYTPTSLRFVEIDGWEESKANSAPRPALTNRGRGTLRVFVSGAIENDCLATELKSRLYTRKNARRLVNYFSRSREKPKSPSIQVSLSWTMACTGRAGVATATPGIFLMAVPMAMNSTSPPPISAI